MRGRFGGSSRPRTPLRLRVLANALVDVREGAVQLVLLHQIGADLSHCCRERCDHVLRHGAGLALGAMIMNLIGADAVEALALGAAVGRHRAGLELRRLRRSLVERRHVALRKAIRALQRNTYDRPAGRGRSDVHGSSTAPFARSLPLTLSLIPNPPSGALHAPDADANHGSQVGPAKLRLTNSESSHSSLPVEPTLRL